jgi:hypothetical protein
MELHGGSTCIGGEPESGPTQPTASPDVRFRSKSVRIWAAREIDASATSRRSAPEVLARWWQVRYRSGRGAERMPVLRCGWLRLGVPSRWSWMAPIGNPRGGLADPG